MKRLFILLLLGLFITPLACSQTQTVTVSQKADTLLQECIEFNESVGIAAGLMKSDSIIWRGAAGYMDLANKTPANINTRHRIASIAKPMTAIAILQLYEKNKLNLDDTIQKYLPYFPQKKQGDITIKHLLQHTSGIAAYESYEESAPLKDYKTLEEAIAIFKNRPLSHKPGTEYKYTTYGYVVLGAIIEKVSGLSFRDYMKKNIWDIAGMANTDVEIYGQQYKNKTKLYYRNNYGGLVMDRVTNLSSKVPGGGFYSTVEDLLKFGQAVLEHKLIKPSTFNLMITDPKIKKGGNPYTMGWFIYENKNSSTGKVIGHTGSQSGSSSYFQIFLGKKIVVTTLSNTAEANNFIKDVTDKLVNTIIYPQTISKPLKTKITLSSEEQKVYIGSFEKEGRIINVFEENTNLFITINNRFKTQLHPTSKDNFFVRWGDTDYKFLRDDQNQINTLIIIENGTEASYPKKNEKPSLAISIQELINKKQITNALNLLQHKYENNYVLDVDDLTNLGDKLIEEGKYDLALTYFTRLSKRFPKVLDYIEYLGKVKLKLGENNDARELFVKSAPIRSRDGFYQMAINPVNSYQPTKVPENSKLLFEYRGNLNNKEVFVFLQGGPDPFLSIDNRRDPFAALSNRENLLRVYPYQSQMLNHSVFSPKSTLSYNDAIFERTQSAEIIYQTIKYFKKQGKKVYLFAHSFGSQLTLEYLESKTNNADKIIIMGARLDNDIKNYPDLAPGKLIRWDKGLKPYVATWHNNYSAMPLIEDDFYQVIKNTKQLVQVHRNKKFTNLLKDKSLKNITFVYAKFDEASGRQNDKDLNFLKSKGVVTIGTYGDHHSMLSQRYITHFINSIIQNETIKPSLAYALSNYIENHDIDAALDWYNTLDKKDYFIIESELNTLGYDLVTDKKLKEAIEIFKMNVSAFPNSWNVYDSLGETYMAVGNNKLAIKNYKKSLQINPTNSYAIEALKKLN